MANYSATKWHRKQHKTNAKDVTSDNSCFDNPEQILSAKLCNNHHHIKQLVSQYILKATGRVNDGILYLNYL